MSKKCERCKFFHDLGSGYGECRRHTPVLVDIESNDGIWPDVKYYDWCGEYEREPGSDDE